MGTWRSRWPALLCPAALLGRGRPGRRPDDQVTLRDPALAASNALATNCAGCCWTSVPVPETVAVIGHQPGQQHRRGAVRPPRCRGERLGVFLPAPSTSASRMLGTAATSTSPVGRSRTGRRRARCRWTPPSRRARRSGSRSSCRRASIWIVTRNARRALRAGADRPAPCNCSTSPSPDWVTDGTFVGNTAVLRTTGVIIAEHDAPLKLARCRPGNRRTSIRTPPDGGGLVLEVAATRA